MTHSFDSIKLSVSQFEFLNLQNNDNYINNILNIATNELISAIDQQESLLELEFPIDRKSDISSSETLDGTKSFTLQLLSKLLSRRNYSKNDICFVLPEKQEIFRISKEVDIDKLSFAVAALDYFPQGISPSLVFIINPGFNIEEWIQIPKIVQNLPTIKSVVLVNGNINRLLSGYYPSIFYPGLAKVTKDYFIKSKSILNLQPLSINGDRYGGWYVKTFTQSNFMLIRSPSSKVNGNSQLVCVHQDSKVLQPNDIWKLSKREYTKLWN